MKISIIGAGIGGLTTALALKQVGQKATIYEGANEIKAVGAGILLANNAMQIFKKLGVQSTIEKAGCIISNVKTSDAQLNTLLETELSHFEKKYSVRNTAIHRADLHKILADEVGYENIKLGKRLIKIENKKPCQLFFDDGTFENTDVIIGADGLRSITRTQLFGEAIYRDTKQKCWRGICDINWISKYNYEAIEAWGRGKRFGFVKISANKVYWYAVVNSSMFKEINDIHNLFLDFHPDIQKMIAETPTEQIILNDIKDLNHIPNWHKGNVCLLGDAAHATTPNMGQGACQAVEDAYVLAQLFKQGLPLENIFSNYEKLRQPRARYIVNTSWKIGTVAHYENALAVWMRNFLVKSTPKSVVENQLNKVFDIEYTDNLG